MTSVNAVLAPTASTAPNTEAAQRRRRPRRVVVKVGTSLLTSNGTVLDQSFMRQLAAQLIAARRAGWEVVLVTSGAIAAGRLRFPLDRNGKDIPSNQMLAAIGQSQLMRVYDDLFACSQTIIAQALLTKRDLDNRAGYLNARNTLLGLLEHGVLPIVNENDVVAVDELPYRAGFGDNDTLSAMVANLVDADLLILLTDTEGLYKADPRRHANPELVREVRRIDGEIERIAGGAGSQQGTGGMKTKVEAARLATRSGITVWVALGKEPQVVPRLLAGQHIGTRFHPARTRAEARRRWILSALAHYATVHIDAGAVTALLAQGRSLLPVGIRAVEGQFGRGAPVSIVGPAGQEIACGLTNYTAEEVARIKGQHSDQIEAILGHTFGDEVVHRNNLVVLPEQVVGRTGIPEERHNGNSS